MVFSGEREKQKRVYLRLKGTNGHLYGTTLFFLFFFLLIYYFFPFANVKKIKKKKKSPVQKIIKRKI